MSWNIVHGKDSATPFIAKVMQLYQIDICAVLEVANPAADTFTTKVVKELDNLNYHNGQWKRCAVNVGDQAVVYIWHESAAGANAFKAMNYTNVAEAIRGKVMRNDASGSIYFPTKQIAWGSLPGKPNGRRPAYLAFETNDGQPKRYFTFLDLHAPDNSTTHIQAYSAFLYASSREIQRVETLNASAGATAARDGVIADLAGLVDPLLLTYGTPLTVRTDSVQNAVDRIKDLIDEDDRTDQATLLAEARDYGIARAVESLGVLDARIPVAHAQSLAKACAMAGAVGAIRLVASMQLPTAPTAPIDATASVAFAAQVAQNVVTGTASNYIHPATPTPAKITQAIENEAERVARLATAPFTFAPFPTQALNASVIAGDFNVYYPDTDIVYNTTMQAKLGGRADAYAALTAATSGAQNTERSTFTGGTAFKKQRVYSLRNPIPIQHTDTTVDGYVELNVTSLAGIDFMGYPDWIGAMDTLAKRQNIGWARLENSPYQERLSGAFAFTNVYSLRDPIPIQHINSAADGYVELDVTSLAGVDHAGYDAWIRALQALATKHRLDWAQLQRKPYKERLDEAFDGPDFRMLDDTSFYRVNCYDNIFVRGATVISHGLIDVQSELGSWRQGPSAPLLNAQPPLRQNPWPAAKGLPAKQAGRG
jgi:hypothetical protein